MDQGLFDEYEHPVYRNEIFCAGYEVHEFDENKTYNASTNTFYKDGKALRALYRKWKWFVFEEDHENEDQSADNMEDNVI